MLLGNDASNKDEKILLLWTSHYMETSTFLSNFESVAQFYFEIEKVFDTIVGANSLEILMNRHEFLVVCVDEFCLSIKKI